jgi:N-acylneuraminate cytidylyltransferase
MGNLAIIPARGGSKRIPRKNCKNFLGKPIIAYSIEVALNSGLFEEIMVSTDDREIAEIAQKYGAKVPFMRSAENSNDFATTIDVIEEVLTQYQNRNRHFDNVCCIYPTAPLAHVEDLKKGLQLLTDSHLDSVFPVTPFSFPIQRSVVIENMKTRFAHPEFSQTRSQDLETHYHDAGQWYWLNFQNFLATKKIITDNTSSIILDELQVQDIDNETDWKLAELKYELLQSLT